MNGRFDPDERRGELVTTGLPGGVRLVTCVASVSLGGDVCATPVEVPWEDLPRVWNGSIDRCLVHRNYDLPGAVLTAEQVTENVVRERAAATERWDAHLTRKAA